MSETLTAAIAANRSRRALQTAAVKNAPAIVLMRELRALRCECANDNNSKAKAVRHVY